MVGREDAVVVALGGRDLAGRDDGDAGETSAPRPLRAAAARAAARTDDVVREEDRLRAEGARRAHRLRDRIAAAHDEAGAEPAQRVVEVSERRGEQRRTPFGDGEQRVVEHEQRQHALGLARRRGERPGCRGRAGRG